MPSMEHNRKRPHPNPSSYSSARKRTQIDSHFAIPSPENSDLTNKAGCAFPVPQVPGAIGSLCNPSLQSVGNFYTLTQEPQSDSFYNQSSESAGPPFIGGSGAPTIYDLAPVATMNECNNSSFLEGVLHLVGKPHQWTECLPKIGFRDEPTYQAKSTNIPQHPFISPDDGSFPSEKPFISVPGPVIHTFEPYSDKSRGQVLGRLTEDQDGYHFWCDDISTPPSWQSNYPVLEPIQVETTQPFINAQRMIYPRNPSSHLETPWNQNSHQGGYEIGFYTPPQTSHTQGGESHLKEGKHVDELEPPDRAPIRGGLSPTRRREFQNPNDRIQTAQTRKDKACVRCKMQRIRCLPNPSNSKGVCLTCQNVTHIKTSRLPCLRYKITEIKLYKPGQVPGFEWTRRWPDSKLKDITNWASTETKVIHTTEGFSSVPLELVVREFVPIDGDALDRHWVAPDNIKRSVMVPSYAIVDVNAARNACMDYINGGGAEFFKGWLNDRDELLVETYKATIEAASNPNTPVKEAKLLNLVLQLWLAIRITTRSIRICGEETLGMSKDILDETSPLHGKIPVPPVMGAQIELILIQDIQHPWSKAVLDLLQSFIMANKPNTWFTIYLCIFILLHNCALMTKYDYGYARKHGIKTSYARPGMVEEYHTGANILLAYWHYCNKGFHPFGLGNSAAYPPTMANLNVQQANLVRWTSSYVQANANTWASLREKRAYGEDFFFVSQLYEEDWQPRISAI